LALLWLKFFASTFCIKINILGVNVFTISDWFAQMLQYQNFNPNKRWFGFPLILTVEIWTKGEPIKEISDDVVNVDIEMGKVDESQKFWTASSTNETTLPQPPLTDDSLQHLPPHPSVETKETKNEGTASTETVDSVTEQQVKTAETKEEVATSADTVTSIENVTEQQVKTAETKEEVATSTDTVTSVENVTEQQVKATETKEDVTSVESVVIEQQAETKETKNEAAASNTVVTTNDDSAEKTEAAEEVDDVVTTSDNKTTETSSSKKKKKKNNKK